MLQALDDVVENRSNCELCSFYVKRLIESYCFRMRMNDGSPMRANPVSGCYAFIREIGKVGRIEIEDVLMDAYDRSDN